MAVIVSLVGGRPKPDNPAEKILSQNGRKSALDPSNRV
jgi:hypothetical protein